MAHNMLLQNRLLGIQSVLMAVHAGGKGLPSSMIGSEREAFIRHFWNEVFPLHRRMSSGAITDSRGSEAGQIDIAVEFGFLPTFPLPGSSERLMLAESVAVVIEVKSDLSSQFGQAVEKARQVKTLIRSLEAIVPNGPIRVGPSIPVVVVGYEGYKTLEGLRNHLSEINKDGILIDAALCIESGAFARASGGPEGFGGHGFLALCAFISEQFEAVSRVTPNLEDYVGNVSGGVGGHANSAAGNCPSGAVMGRTTSADQATFSVSGRAAQSNVMAPVAPQAIQATEKTQ